MSGHEELRTVFAAVGFQCVVVRTVESCVGRNNVEPEPQKGNVVSPVAEKCTEELGMVLVSSNAENVSPAEDISALGVVESTVDCVKE